MAFYGMTETKKGMLARFPEVEVVKSKLAMRNTVDFTDSSGVRHIVLHSTEIVTFAHGGKIILNSGGWRTPTTAGRINHFLPKGMRVGSHKGSWVVSYTEYEDTGIENEWGGMEARVKFSWTVPFWEGMVIEGRKAPKLPQDAVDEAQRVKRLTKLIKKYTDAMRAMKQLPRPEAGDCLICQMHSKDMANLERYPSMDCLESHLEETYVHGSLIYNALRWANYRNDQMPFVFGGDIAIRAVRRFFRAQLNIA